MFRINRVIPAYVGSVGDSALIPRSRNTIKQDFNPGDKFSPFKGHSRDVDLSVEQSGDSLTKDLIVERKSSTRLRRIRFAIIHTIVAIPCSVEARNYRINRNLVAVVW